MYCALLRVCTLSALPPQPPTNFEADTWSKLRAAVRAVHAKQSVGHSLEELYRAVEDMCLQGLAATVYDRLRSECETIRPPLRFRTHLFTEDHVASI